MKISEATRKMVEILGFEENENWDVSNKIKMLVVEFNKGGER